VLGVEGRVGLVMMLGAIVCVGVAYLDDVFWIVLSDQQRAQIGSVSFLQLTVQLVIRLSLIFLFLNVLIG